MPSRSSAISRLSASTRSKLMLVVFGTRGVARAVDRGARHARRRMPASRRSRSAPTRAASAAIFAAASARRDAQAGNRRHVLGAGAPVALVLAAGQDRLHPRAALDPQRAGALRAVELVRRQRQQIDAERADVDRDLADRLHRVGVHQRAALVRDRARVRRSAESCRSRCSRASPRRAPCRRRWRRAARSGETTPDVIDRESVVRQPRRASALQRVQHRLVFDRARDQMPASGRLERLGGAADREVVRLGAAAREHDLRRIGVDQGRDRRPRLVQRAPWPAGRSGARSTRCRTRSREARDDGVDALRAPAASSRCSQSRHASVNRSLYHCR